MGIPSGFCSVSASAHDGRTHVRAVQASTAISGGIVTSMSDSGLFCTNAGLTKNGGALVWPLHLTSFPKWFKYDMHVGSLSSSVMRFCIKLQYSTRNTANTVHVGAPSKLFAHPSSVIVGAYSIPQSSYRLNELPRQGILHLGRRQ